MYLGCFQSNGALHRMDYADFAAIAFDIGYVTLDVPVLNDAAVKVARSLDMALHATGSLTPPDLSTESDQQAALTRQVTDAIDWAAGHGIGACF